MLHERWQDFCMRVKHAIFRKPLMSRVSSCEKDNFWSYTVYIKFNAIANIRENRLQWRPSIRNHACVQRRIRDDHPVANDEQVICMTDANEDVMPLDLLEDQWLHYNMTYSTKLCRFTNLSQDGVKIHKHLISLWIYLYHIYVSLILLSKEEDMGWTGMGIIHSSASPCRILFPDLSNPYLPFLLPCKWFAVSCHAHQSTFIQLNQYSYTD